VSNQEDSAYDPFAGPTLVATAESTAAQREIWIACQLGDDASLAFNESVTLRLRGEMKRDALRAAFTDLCARHEALRMTFSGDGLTLCVAAPSQVAPQIHDWQAHAPGQREAELEQLCATEVRTPFDLTAGPLFRAHLICATERETWLVFTAHHIVCDGWSTAVLMRDWAALYGARLRGAAAELRAAESFTEYARSRAQQDLRSWSSHEAFWVAQFTGEIPVLDLPTDRPRPPRKTFVAERVDAELPTELVTELRKVGAKQRASLFATLLAGFKALVHRLSAQRDLVVGIPSAGQAAEGHAELVGHCVNMLPLRTRLEPDAPFGDLLGSVRKTLLDAQEHQDFTFGTLLTKLPIERDPSRLPLVSVIFNVDRGMTSEALGFSGAVAELEANPRAFENFDLFLNAVELGGAIKLECQFNRDLFDRATIRRWLDAYRLLLTNVAGDPATPLNRLAVLSDADRAQLAAWNATTAAFPSSLCLHELCERQAQAHPERVACEFGDLSLTFRELDMQANRVARRLRALGVKRGALVGICLERSLELLVGLLGISKAGAGYLPLDPGYPRDRLAFMVDDSQMLVLLTDSRLQAELTLPAAQILCIDQGADTEDASALPKDEASATPDSVAYVIYTSGSTGRPKGVLVPHRAAVNLVSSVARRPGLNADDVVLAITTLSFDIAVSETWLPLSVGARIVLVTREVASDGAQLRAVCEGRSVTFVDATPATYRLLLAAGWQGGDARTLICTGEAMPKDLALELVNLGRTVWNGYGPTETTVWSTFWRVPGDFSRILIGTPVDNTAIHILDATRNPVPLGAVGELYIAGQGVSLGYLNRPELTAERFVPDVLSGSAAVMYRTGDLGRYLSNGEIECLGRNDNQVKLRGYRIELGEIDDALVQHSALSGAAVLLREDRPGDARLVAYVVAKQGTAQAADLRAHLKKTLPDYMVPTTFVMLDRLPLTPSGKIDRRALPIPDAQGVPSDAEFTAPRDETERLLAELWAKALGVGRVSVHDDFFALGGHSLLASQILARLRRDHGIELSFRKFFEAPTVARLAELVRKEPITESAPAARVTRRASIASSPLSLGQERLWLLEEMHPAQRLVHTLPAAWRFEGPLDRELLQQGLDRIAERQEMLRITIGVEGNHPVQRVAERIALPIGFVDLCELPVDQRQAAMHAQIKRLTLEPFDLGRGPLFRSTLFRLSEEEHVYFTLRHNVIWDGWSFDVFLSELCAIYSALQRGEPPVLPELPIGYGDFVVWQRQWQQGPELRRQIDFWQKALVEPNVDLALPHDYPRPAQSLYGGANAALNLGRAEGDALAALAHHAGASPFTVLLAAFSVLLWRYSGQNEVLVGTPVRARNLPEVEHLIGPFINAVILRTRIEPSLPFVEYVKRVRDLTLDAFSNQDMPLELLGTRPPLVRAFFSYQDARSRPLALGSSMVKQIDVEPPAAANDLMLWMMERPGELLAACNYSTEIFEASTIERLLRSFATLLRAVIADPQRRLNMLEILAPQDASEVRAFTSTLAPATTSSAPSWLAECAQESPQAIALVQGQATLSFSALWERAACVAARLTERGLSTGTVAIVLPRSFDLAAAAYGCWLAGCAVLPIDPSVPNEYQERILSAAKPVALLTQSALQSRVASRPGMSVLLVDEQEGVAVTRSEHALQIDPNQLAWLGYRLTGGELRLAPASHVELVTRAETFARLAGVDASRALSLAAMPSADALPLELLLGPLCGAPSLLAKASARDDETLHELLRDGNVGCAFGTPEAWREILGNPPSGLREMTAVVLGPLSEPLLESLLAGVKRVLRIDAPFDVGIPFMHEIASFAHMHRLGKPLGRVQVSVQAAVAEELPIGVAAELFIRRDGAAAPTATGVSARWHNDGSIEVTAAEERELSAGGSWFDLSEVSAALEGHRAVKRAYVRSELGERGAARLTAFLVLDREQSYTESELRRQVRASLPEALVPQLFVELDNFPTSENGAVNVSQLRSPADTERQHERVAPRSDTERVLVELFADALHLQDVGIHDNFFDLGGHSLLCFRVLERIEQRLHKRLSPRVLLLNSLEQVAAEIDGQGAAASAIEYRSSAQEPAGLGGRVFKKFRGLLRR
jgi:amino acid adenylation domain-containing protein